VLMKHCYECHGGGEAKGGFSMNTLALWMDKKAAVPGNAEKSLVIELIEEPDPDFAMPPKGKPRLTAAELKVLDQRGDELGGRFHVRQEHVRAAAQAAPARTARRLRAWPREPGGPDHRCVPQRA